MLFETLATWFNRPVDGWLIIGFCGQGIFALRFVVQWWHSEKQQRSVVPEGFWYLSLVGGLTLLVYAVKNHDPVIVLGQLAGLGVYLRNIYFIWQVKALANGKKLSQPDMRS